MSNEDQHWLDEFAKAALTGMLASWHEGDEGRLYPFGQLAEDAYGIARAMLAERKKAQGNS